MYTCSLAQCRETACRVWAMGFLWGFHLCHGGSLRVVFSTTSHASPIRTCTETLMRRKPELTRAIGRAAGHAGCTGPRSRSGDPRQPSRTIQRSSCSMTSVLLRSAVSLRRSQRVDSTLLASGCPSMHSQAARSGGHPSLLAQTCLADAAEVNCQAGGTIRDECWTTCKISRGSVTPPSQCCRPCWPHRSSDTFSCCEALSSAQPMDCIGARSSATVLSLVSASASAAVWVELGARAMSDHDAKRGLLWADSAARPPGEADHRRTDIGNNAANHDASARPCTRRVGGRAHTADTSVHIVVKCEMMRYCALYAYSRGLRPALWVVRPLA